MVCKFCVDLFKFFQVDNDAVEVLKLLKPRKITILDIFECSNYFKSVKFFYPGIIELKICS